jgi:hypothetical protein
MPSQQRAWAAISGSQKMLYRNTAPSSVCCSTAAAAPEMWRRRCRSSALVEDVGTSDSDENPPGHIDVETCSQQSEILYSKGHPALAKAQGPSSASGHAFTVLPSTNCDLRIRIMIPSLDVKYHQQYTFLYPPVLCISM